MKNEFSVNLGTKNLTLYSLTFRTDSKLIETTTVNSGIIRRLTGNRRNFYTLKGRIPYGSFLSFCSYINSLIGSSVTLSFGGGSVELILTKGECTAKEEGMSEYEIELEEAE